jgi:hypothetical protein
MSCKQHPENENIPHTHLVDEIRAAVDADIEIHLGKIEDLFAHSAVAEHILKDREDGKQFHRQLVISVLIQRLFELLAHETLSGAQTTLEHMRGVVACRIGRDLLNMFTERLSDEGEF